MIFRTLANFSEGYYKEKGSKFLAFAYPVDDADEINEKLAALRKSRHDARHHCYAWVLGMESQSWRTNDDGEPGHSAGDPILGQIRSFDLTHTLVVVVRYFGGTKLGVGGLINAYRTAAKEALEKAAVKEIYPTIKGRITFSYGQTSLVERAVDLFGFDILDKEFREVCHMDVSIKKDLFKEAMIYLSENSLHFEEETEQSLL